MAYSEYAVASHRDVIARIVDFVTPLGFVVTGNGVDTVTLNVGGWAADRVVKLTVAGTTSENITVDVDANINAILRAPRLSVVGSPTVGVYSQPTRMFALSSMEEGVPYCAFVIEYGFNNVRHIYLGNLVKRGTFDDGQVIDVSGFVSQTLSGLTATSGTSIWSRPRNLLKPLFTSQCSNIAMPDATRGGVGIIADGVPRNVKFRYGGSLLGATTTSYLRSIAALDGVYGGFGDGINDPYVSCGLNRAEAAAILTPMNLYIPRTVATSVKTYPLGHPAGIRMLTLEDLQPYGDFATGTTEWRSFPAARRQPVPTVFGNAASTSTQSFISAENSAYLGYAYRTN